MTEATHANDASTAPFHGPLGGLDWVDEHVGDRIKIIRAHRGFSQPVLAAALGMTHQMLGKYERGESRISASRLYQICKILQCTIEDIFDGLDVLRGAINAKAAMLVDADVDIGPDGIEIMRHYAGMTRLQRAVFRNLARVFVNPSAE